MNYERDITSASRDYNIFFIHSVLKDWTPSANSLIRESVPWQRKMEVVMALAPTISASTIREGDSEFDMWSRFGLILSNGIILAAGPRDYGGRAKGIKHRNLAFQTDHDLSLAIEKAIRREDPGEEHRERLSRLGYTHNEFVIQDPVVAGFYLSTDYNERSEQYSNSRVREVPSIEDIAAFVTKYNLRLYSFHQGKFYSARIGANNEVYRDDPIRIEDILMSTHQLSAKVREELIEDIRFHSPFKTVLIEPPITNFTLFGESGNPGNTLGDPDVLYFDAKVDGEKQYIVNQLKKDVYPKDLAVIKAKGSVSIYGYSPEEGEVWKKLTEIRGPDRLSEIVLTEGRLAKRVIMRTRSYDGVSGDWRSPYAIFYSGLIPLGRNDRVLFEEGCHDIQDYLSKSEKIIEDALLVLNSGILYTLPDINVPEFLDRLLKIAFHFYGISEQAQKWGDQSTRDKTLELATRILPVEDYEHIVKKRIGRDGRFLLTNEELGLE